MTTPARRDRMKPLELVIISLIIGVFGGGIVLMSTRELLLSAISFGIAFIVSLVVIAMLVLSAKPNKAELLDIEEQNQPVQDGASPPAEGQSSAH
jgi:arginine exporter protein ArgO